MELAWWQWWLGMLAAFLVGLAKGGVPGVGNLVILIFVYTFPARASVGLLLPVLVCADLAAVTIYRRHAQWLYILRLLPWVIPGLLIGWWTLDAISNTQLRRLIGFIILGMTGAHFFHQRFRKVQNTGASPPLPHALWFQIVLGTLAGFATMTANAAGPVAEFYLLAAGLPKLAFIGTKAWFFFLVNLIKLPMQARLDLINAESLAVSLSLGPLAFLGAILAPRIVKRIRQKLFTLLIWTFIILAGIKLVF